MPSVPLSPPAESLELPDLDKGDESDEVDVGTFELDMNVGDDADEDAVPLDAFELDIQVLTDSGGNEAAEDLDIGGAQLLLPLPDDAGDAGDEPRRAEKEELDLHLDRPLESDEPSHELELGNDGLEDLPELVGDDDDGDAGPDVERAYLPSAPEGAIAQGPSYESEWQLLGTTCSALAIAHGDVLAAADHLMRFGAERHNQGLPAGARVSSLAFLEGERVMVATNRGLLRVAPSGAVTLETDAARLAGAPIVELATTLAGRSRLWARAASGGLLRLREGAWERHQTGGAVRALTSDEQRINLLVVSHRPTLQLSSDGGSSFREVLLPEPAATVAQGGAPTVVSQGTLVALADPERGVCVSSDGGESFRMVVGAVNVTAVAIGQHEGAPALFAAVHRESKDLTELLVIDVSNASPARIAELSGEPDEEAEETGRTQALLFASGWLWAAGGYGLVRLRSPRS